MLCCNQVASKSTLCKRAVVCNRPGPGTPPDVMSFGFDCTFRARSHSHKADTRIHKDRHEDSQGQT
eukprot:scaffold168731_cov19-Tisochrysis_lutea.AAC.1